MHTPTNEKELFYYIVKDVIKIRKNTQIFSLEISQVFELLIFTP